MGLFPFFLQAQKEVNNLLYHGPILCVKPIMSDSLDVNGAAFDENELLKSFPISDKYFSIAQNLGVDTAKYVTFKSDKQKYSIYFFKTYITVERFVKGKVEVKGNGIFEIYVNGTKKKDKSTIDSLPKAVSFEYGFEPMTYELVIKYMARPDSNQVDQKLKVTFTSEKNLDYFHFSTENIRTFSIYNLQDGKNIRGVEISPNGKYCLVDYSERVDNKTIKYAELIDNETGKVMLQNNGYLTQAHWMPKSNLIYYTRDGLKGIELILMNPVDFQIKIIENNLPEGDFTMALDENTLIYTIKSEAPKEKNGMNRILDNSDRYNAFRTRYALAKYDLKTGVYQPLTFGKRSTYLYDISHDSQYILVGSSQTDYTKRPFTYNNLYRLNLATLAIDTLYENEPYAGSAQFSPDDTQLLITGAPEAFSKVGLNIGKEPIANSYDNQLFIFDISNKKVTPITKNFDPSIESAVWNSADQTIYMRVVDKDCNSIYQYNPKSATFTKFNLPEDVVKEFSVASQAPVFNFYGQSASNADRFYFYGGKKSAAKCLYDLSKEKLQNIVLGKVQNWNFKTEDGTTITGRFYLPPHFDSTKTYPMLVYYYGGTTPTMRSLEFSYSMHMYAALGYVVYTLNPSGTIGFGQEFSARHVNAWGIRTADEIIQGTKLFFRTHSYIDSTKVGCFGASYGGFMTMYLQTQTDLFAAAISHAGISALTSYWGEGNWGIGYCSVANADTYPWNNKMFFVNQSPLFSADKIKTPILLLHGDQDDNVPIGESIQMYNALRILGKPVEFIEVEGENHGVSDYYKRIYWAKTMQAWFAKWLQNDPTWWEEIYPKSNIN
jgi:dipeptidyl aminopeptidase/acylaminoacyl peptidase